MLDLNLDMVLRGGREVCCDEIKSTMRMVKNSDAGDHQNLHELSRTQMEDSGTSNSSIINCEEPLANAGDENSSNTTSAFIFDIIKKDNQNNNTTTATKIEEDMSPSSPSPPMMITRQLFPVTGDTGRSGQWLNLSNGEPNSADQELRAVQQKQEQVKKSRRGPRSRSSQYRGVTFYRRTSRWESHIWDCGKQVYLGGFDTAHAAARAYDRAAIKFRGVDADLNFNLSDYEEDREQTKNLSKEEFVNILRRQSNGFSRGSSKYRGVTLHKCGRWEARMGQLLGKKAYDKAAIKHNGREAVTNFDASAYEGEMVVDSNSAGSCHNLDLSLGISQPSNDSNRNDNGGIFQYSYVAAEMPNREKTVVENSAYAPAGLQMPPPLRIAMASEHCTRLGRIHSGLLPNFEARALEKRVQSVPSPVFTNWAWQVHSNGNVAAMPVLPIAASSGFSSSTTSPATFPVQQQINPTYNNVSFPSPTTSTSQYYHHRS
uniref:Ethylene responsive factor n=1 Tax=Litchi chinensis TaxID=151069 RepID=A0A6H0DV58_LITCN|nr:ethylene responsive factor [Litchi chinensis]